MPDDQFMPTLPTDAPSSWLARNRKIVILGSIVIVLIVVAIFSFFWRPRTSTKTTVNSNTTTNVASTVNAGSDRTTFQRSTVSTTPGAPVKAYVPPTTQDLQQAIQQRQATK